MLKRSFVKLYLIISLFYTSCDFLKSQSPDYRDIFRDDWNNALIFERENRSWMEPLLTKNGISYPVAIAVIFPELVRYSALRDKMEITVLKALYINLGDEYANFSIGRFQMKPSFACLIREQASLFLGRKSGSLFKQNPENDDIRDFRKQIIEELEDPQKQFNYLIAFLKICEKKYRLNRKDETGKIKFLSTAYNYGIDKTATRIDSMINRKFFNTKLFSTENYSYADVSIYWYNQYQAENK